MINGIIFKELLDKDVEMFEFTNNTIIICNDSETKNKLRKEFVKLVDNDAEDHSIIYSMEHDEEELNLKEIMSYKPTCIFKNDTQSFIITVEPTIIFSMTDKNDLWFFDGKKFNAFTDFKGHNEVWETEGILGVYKMFVNCRYGTYEGYEGK